jgi:coxsackievirus/adenovirus receptor
MSISIILLFVNFVTFNIVFVMTGATDSVTKYYQQSLAADARANASTSGPGNPVESSAILRQATEDKMNDTREEFHRRQEEHAKRLDDLAGQLETLDLSELNVKVSPSKAISEA